MSSFNLVSEFTGLIVGLYLPMAIHVIYAFCGAALAAGVKAVITDSHLPGRHPPCYNRQHVTFYFLSNAKTFDVKIALNCYRFMIGKSVETVWEAIDGDHYLKTRLPALL